MLPVCKDVYTCPIYKDMRRVDGVCSYRIARDKLCTWTPEGKPLNQNSSCESYCVDGSNGPSVFYKERKRDSHIIDKTPRTNEHWC